MKTIPRKILHIAAASLITASVAHGESSLANPDEQSGSKTDHNVSVEVSDVVTVAVGKGSKATVQIGTVARPGEDDDVKVKIGNIYRGAFGSDATVCVEMPFVGKSAACDQ